MQKLLKSRISTGPDLEAVSELVMTKKIPIFKLVKGLCTDPIKSLKDCFILVWPSKEEMLISKIENLQKILLNFCNMYDINLYTIGRVAVAFVIAAMLYKRFISSINRRVARVSDNSLTFNRIYYGIWILVFLVGYLKCIIREYWSSITFISLSSGANMLGMCLGVGLVALFLFLVYFSFYPYLLLIIPLVSTTAFAIFISKNENVPPIIKIGLAISIISFIIGAVIFYYENKKINKKKISRVIQVLWKNSLFLAIFFSISTLVQYLQVIFLIFLWKLSSNKPWIFPIVVFLFTWSYYYISYLNRLFTSIMIDRTVRNDFLETGVQNMAPNTDETLKIVNLLFIECSNYIVMESLIPAGIYSLIYILQAIRLFTPLELISSSISFLEVFIILKDSEMGITFNHIAELDKISFFRIKDVLTANDTNQVKGFFKKAFTDIFNLQAFVYIGFALLYFSNNTSFIANYTHLAFPLFMGLNILIYFMNAVYTTGTIRDNYKRKAEIIKIDRAVTDETQETEGLKEKRIKAEEEAKRKRLEAERIYELERSAKEEEERRRLKIAAAKEKLEESARKLRANRLKEQKRLAEEEIPDALLVAAKRIGAGIVGSNALSSSEADRINAIDAARTKRTQATAEVTVEEASETGDLKAIAVRATAEAKAAKEKQEELEAQREITRQKERNAQREIARQAAEKRFLTGTGSVIPEQISPLDATTKRNIAKTEAASQEPEAIAEASKETTQNSQKLLWKQLKEKQ